MPKCRTTIEKLSIFKDAFTGRHDIHGTRDLKTGRGRCEKSPPDDRVLLDHLRGRRPAGVYPLVVDRCRFAAIDLDHEDTEPVFTLDRLARDLGHPPLIERSKSKGWHLWWFADEGGWSAQAIRRLLRGLTDEAQLPGVEVFPKQDRLSPGSFGNFIYLPLDGRLVPEGRTIFVNADRWLTPVTDPWEALTQRQCVSMDQINVANSGMQSESDHDRQGAESKATAADESKRSGTQSEISWPLPPCARRMLAEGVTENQRVACFRLAVHFHRLGVPEDVAVAALNRWSRKNQPRDGRRVITTEEVKQQTHEAFRKGYRSYGCEDPFIAAYCGEMCPVRGSTREKQTTRSENQAVATPRQPLRRQERTG